MRDLGEQPDSDDAWYGEWVRPVAHALHAGDESQARAALAAAYASPRSAALSAAFCEHVDYRLPYMAFLIELYAPGDPARLEAAYAAALRRLQEPCSTDFGARSCARYLLQLRCLADEAQLDPLEAEEFGRLLQDAVDRGANAEMWYYGTGWAFARRRLDVIEAALEFLTVTSTRYFADFLWQRVNLMHLLLAGRAARQDVVELVQRVKYYRHMAELERQLWPACIAAGLVDAEMQAAWDDRRRALRELPTVKPRPARVTGSIRAGL